MIVFDGLALPEDRRYLKSPEWQARKRQYYGRHSRRCASCGTYSSKRKVIHLHHSSYDRRVTWLGEGPMARGRLRLYVFGVGNGALSGASGSPRLFVPNERSRRADLRRHVS